MTDTKEYTLGYNAFKDGISVKDNPYNQTKELSNERLRWYTGWFDAKYKPLLDKMDEKYPPKKT